MRAHDLVIALLVALGFVLLSIPYQFAFDHWSESPALWVAYFVVGAVLAAYVFYAFLQSRRRLAQSEESQADGAGEEVAR